MNDITDCLRDWILARMNWIRIGFLFLLASSNSGKETVDDGSDL